MAKKKKPKIMLSAKIMCVSNIIKHNEEALPGQVLDQIR